MELRVLQYFLAVSREQSLSGAAEFLHLSQPTLSRQLKDLEEELGKQLFLRGNRGITLTEEGMILRKRAEEILDLVKKTASEVSLADEVIAGDVYIGAGESDVNRCLARAAREMKQSCPDVHFHISSGNAVYVTEQLDKGLIDFGIVYGAVDQGRYHFLRVPFPDTFGLLMRRDDELAAKEFLTGADLAGKPLIVSYQEANEGWPVLTQLSQDISRLDVVATYTLIYNGSLLVSEGLGYAVCFDKLINTAGSDLCFRPFRPAVTIQANVVWKKYQVFSKAAERFLQHLQTAFAQGAG